MTKNSWIIPHELPSVFLSDLKTFMLYWSTNLRKQKVYNIFKDVSDKYFQKSDVGQITRNVRKQHNTTSTFQTKSIHNVVKLDNKILPCGVYRH